MPDNINTPDRASNEAARRPGNSHAPTSTPNRSVMFIAGEPSGDAHAAAAIRRIKERDGGVDVWGIGGPKMEAAGFEAVMPFDGFNRMGYVEVLRHLPFFLSAKKKLLGMMSASRRPGVLVCVDYSGFNMPMMKEARKLGIPVVWYIAPMVWAWKRKRAAVLGEQASHIAVIFPFEAQYFSSYSAPVTFVGNPLTESLPPVGAAAKKFPGAGGFRLAIIPGSRPQEIKNMLGAMIDAASMLKTKYPAINVAVSRFGRFGGSLFGLAAKRGFEVTGEPLPTLLQRSDLALITSGTATLEAALMGVPMVIAYRTSAVSYAVYKQFVTIDRIGLPNIIAGKTIVPECVQADVNPNKLYCEAERLISIPRLWEEAVQNLSGLGRFWAKKGRPKALRILYIPIYESKINPLSPANAPKRRSLPCAAARPLFYRGV
ncbi:MAG: lipid-A-disaccharide synthase [Chitinispirillales bacterium]|jgi:lipid-A-disaccharide synthase|nr:lipid-A-disaccharide synthase [Chitinispirillales bacterium]